MKQNVIYPCICLKGKMKEAAEFYVNTFGDGHVGSVNPYVTEVVLSGQKLLIMNEGPVAAPSPAVSFMVMLSEPEVTEALWNKLLEGSKVMMALNSYPWSEKYGWLEDKYGVSWQLYTGDTSRSSQKFSPTFMFTGTNAGKAEEAIQLYTQLFPSSAVQGILKYGEGEGDSTDLVKHAQFVVDGFTMMAMDSSYNHGFTINDAVSLVVECDTQDEIDIYWNALTADGGKEVACGWLYDKFGVAWQIVPAKISQWMFDKEKGPRMMSALMKMKKLIIADLENA